MSRGEYYHNGINRRYRMKGGSTREERGYAAEVRSLHELPGPGPGGGGLTRQAQDLAHILNKVIHDPSTAPFPGYDRIEPILNSLMNNNHWSRFMRPEIPDTSEMQSDRNLVNRILNRGQVAKMAAGTYPFTEHDNKLPDDMFTEFYGFYEGMNEAERFEILDDYEMLLRDEAEHYGLTIPDRIPRKPTSKQQSAQVRFIFARMQDEKKKHNIPTEIPAQPAAEAVDEPDAPVVALDPDVPEFVPGGMLPEA